MLSDKKGLALLIVIGLVLMLSILGGTVLMVSTGHFSTSFRQIKRARAYYAAEAAMQHALWSCRSGEYDLSSVPINRPDEINVNGLDVDVRVGAMGSGAAPAGTYPVTIAVQY